MSTDRDSDVSAHLPLTPAVFEILLALSNGDLHGYAILQAVEEGTDGALRLHAGTLYRALARLVDGGLLVEVEAGPDEGGDDRRRTYHLTPLGRRVAAAEARRLARQVGAARDRGLFEEGLEVP